MKIYTKKGDKGYTSLIGGTVVPKHHIRIEAYGTVDELNSHIGLLADQEAVTKYTSLLILIQNKLFVIGSHLASDPDKSRMQLPDISLEDVDLIETSIDTMENELNPLKNFVLPGGHPANSMAHIARCVCRRAERSVVNLSTVEKVNPVILTYLNRLSDLLFVLSRYISHSTGSKEILWEGN